MNKNKKIAIGVGLGLGAIGIIWLANRPAKGATPPPPPEGEPFSFTNVWGEKVTLTGAPAWQTGNIYATISNPADVQNTHIISVKWYYQDSGGQTTPRSIYSESITLEVGQSIDFVMLGNYFENGEWLAYFAIGSGQTHHLWLEDELGNRSDEVIL